MSDQLQKLLIWAIMGAGALLAILVLDGRWLGLALLGTAIGIVMPLVLRKASPVETGAGVSPRQQVSLGNTLRWVGAIVAAMGGFLLWKMLGEGNAPQLRDAGHPWLASTTVYLAGLPIGLGLTMLVTNFNFMKSDLR